jgi:hypothetical protein
MSESKRGCGYRKIGGTYLMGGRLADPCGRLPLPLRRCATCGGGIKQSRGWTWVDPAALLGQGSCSLSACTYCPLSNPARMADEQGRCGLLWVGEGFYKTPSDFALEASTMGVCRRIRAVPKGAVIGKTWILLAHPKAFPLSPEEVADLELDPTVDNLNGPGIFAAFVLTGIERMVSEEESRNKEEMEKLIDKGITPVVLPDIPEHRGSVFDKEPELELGDSQ